MAKKQHAKSVVETGGPEGTVVDNGVKKPTQSPVVGWYDIGEPGVTACLREDGNVTITVRSRGVAQKVVSMYILQWAEFTRILPRIFGAINNGTFLPQEQS